MVALAEGSNEAAKIVVPIVSMVVSLLTACVVTWIGLRERARCRKEDVQERQRAQWASTIERMELRLEDADKNGAQLVQKLVEERIRAASHEINNHVHAFVVGLDGLKAKAEDAAEEVKLLNEADHENKLSFAVQMGNLKEWMRQTFADKQDFKAMDAQVRQLDNKVAVLASRAGGKAG